MSIKYILLFIVFVSSKSFAQEANDSAASQWNFSAMAGLYLFSGGKDFVNPMFYAHHKSLHLEGRYNYENLNTGSVWVGWEFKFGHAVEGKIVPMGGIVVGKTNGAAPGLEFSVAYKKLDFYSESEYLFDFRESQNDFFNMYSELAIKPLKSIRTGIMGQRLKIINLKHNLQRGLFANYLFGKCTAGIFYFNPFSSSDYWIVSFSIDF